MKTWLFMIEERSQAKNTQMDNSCSSHRSHFLSRFFQFFFQPCVILATANSMHCNRYSHHWTMSTLLTAQRHTIFCCCTQKTLRRNAKLLNNQVALATVYSDSVNEIRDPMCVSLKDTINKNTRPHGGYFTHLIILIVGAAVICSEPNFLIMLPLITHEK